LKETFLLSFYILMSLQSSYTQQLYNYKAFLEYFPSKETKVEHTK